MSVFEKVLLRGGKLAKGYGLGEIAFMPFEAGHTRESAEYVPRRSLINVNFPRLWGGNPYPFLSFNSMHPSDMMDSGIRVALPRAVPLEGSFGTGGMSDGIRVALPSPVGLETPSSVGSTAYPIPVAYSRSQRPRPLLLSSHSPASPIRPVLKTTRGVARSENRDNLLKVDFPIARHVYRIPVKEMLQRASSRAERSLSAAHPSPVLPSDPVLILEKRSPSLTSLRNRGSDLRMP